MLAITVELLHGTIHATSPDDLALTGRDEHGDWPPSPGRLFAALVAADGTGSRCRVTDGSELRLLEAAAPPRIHADARDRVLESPLRGRFVVANGTHEGTVQEYPARIATLIRPGVRLAPMDRRVCYVWDDVHASHTQLSGLSKRAARIGYLGCADSPARVRVSDSFDPLEAPAQSWLPDAGGDVGIPVPFPGIIDALDSAFTAWSDGLPVRRSWYRVELAGYRSPEQLVARTPSPWATTIWLTFDGRVPGRHALRVTEALKAAVLSRITEVAGVGKGDMPAVLHGHVDRRRLGYQVAQWLALPNVGGRYSDGRLHGAAIMLPSGDDSGLASTVRAAIRGMRQLLLAGGIAIRLQPYAGGRVTWAANPRRWTTASRHWVSVLPVIHERRTPGEPVLEDVARWCSHAGVPAPASARTASVPLVPGGLSLTSTEVFRDRPGVRRPYSHVEIWFTEPVSGPIVLGRGRQFGMGLMAPVLATA